MQYGLNVYNPSELTFFQIYTFDPAVGSHRGQTLSQLNYNFFFLIVCFTSYFVVSIAVLPHSPGVVYYHLLLRRETRIPGVAPFSFGIGIWDLFVHRGQKSYTPTAFGKLWITAGVRCSPIFSSPIFSMFTSYLSVL